MALFDISMSSCLSVWENLHGRSWTIERWFVWNDL